jgi:hypothetical protein
MKVLRHFALASTVALGMAAGQPSQAQVSAEQALIWFPPI